MKEGQLLSFVSRRECATIRTVAFAFITRRAAAVIALRDFIPRRAASSPRSGLRVSLCNASRCGTSSLVTPRDHRDPNCGFGNSGRRAAARFTPRQKNPSRRGIATRRGTLII
ncbi:RNA-directed DNA polymerase (reversetranscriptase)-related family protein [Striga asiatica]|uniref:RNA-directed DNA polymerase (Reversetranscriptase)-related family protein n=1 Tax=Striga asiatica TaxID=4170 RepID=A0A5A7QB73_STRAF|nr:RNA-directed DNA polymerase (reversetranscriptase)-related family protein [Striga asiatica]